MDTNKNRYTMPGIISNAASSSISRKSFLKLAGISTAALGIGMSMNGCKKDSNILTPPTGSIDLGTGDTAVLNYAYLLEQLESAFYLTVIASVYPGATSDEVAVLTDISLHEQGHRDYLKSVIPSANRIADDLTFNFSSIDFTNRTSVLNAARTFEDTGIKAYNGIGYFIATSDYLAHIGKIVSVEARHSAVIRELISPGSTSFAGDDIVDPASGAENSTPPSQIMPALASYFTITFTYTALP
ncbi:hypothetical protein BH10BAC5_BH10BAC5_14660 [soil metagenome]